jgi:uncharacterized membrane protein
LKTAVRWLLTVFLVLMGVLHFVFPEEFVRMIPSVLPAKAALNVIAGICELAGAIGLQIPRLRKIAAWGLVALFIAVFPANINMAINHISPTRFPSTPFQLWARLPFQALFIAAAWWQTRGPSRKEVRKMVRDIHTC